MNKAKRNLIEALKILGKDGSGWSRHSMHMPLGDGNYSHCSLGAMTYADLGEVGYGYTEDELNSIPGVEELGMAALLMLPNEDDYNRMSAVHRIVHFNDAHATDFQEVEAVFLQAIEYAGEK